MNPTDSGAHCPSCDVQIAPGYPRCPRCHTPLPQTASPLLKAGRAPRPVPGGTSVTHRPSPPWMWIAGGVAIVAIIGIAIALGGEDEGGVERETTDDVAPTEDDLAAQPEPPPAQPVAAAPSAEPVAPEVDERDSAALALESALSSQRLWSTVSVEEDVIVIVSGSCADPEMRAAVDEVRGALAEAELVGLRCVAKHGELVFEIEL